MKHKLNPNDFILDEIESIELIGETDTIDITVDDTHMFYANDIYTHNSSLQNDIIEADSIADSYAKIMNADFVMSLMRKPNDKLNNTARFHVMKNRFGPDGLTFPAKMDTNIGMIKVFENNSPNGMMAMKESKDGEKMERQMLFNKYAEINGHNKSKITGF
jgi:hypothetical protein